MFSLNASYVFELVDLLSMTAFFIIIIHYTVFVFEQLLENGQIIMRLLKNNVKFFVKRFINTYWQILAQFDRPPNSNRKVASSMPSLGLLQLYPLRDT